MIDSDLHHSTKTKNPQGRVQDSRQIVLLSEATFPPPTRGNLRMFHLGKVLTNEGFRCSLVSPSWWPWTRTSGASRGVFFQQFPGFGAMLYTRLRILVRAVHMVTALCTLLVTNHKSQVSVVHGWNTLAGFTAMKGAELVGSRGFVDFTDLYSDIAGTDSPLLSSMFARMEASITDSASHIFVVSEEMKHLLSKRYHRTEGVTVVPDGVDPTNLSNSKNPSGLPIVSKLQGKFVCMFHGDIKAHDGIEVLLEAIRAAGKRNPNVHLLIVGGDPPQLRKTAKQIRELHIEEKVTATGWVPYEEIAQYLLLADVGILPLLDTLNNNLYYSFKLFEYWGAAKPVIVTKVKTIAPLVEANQAGIVIDFEDPEEMSQSILFLLSRPDLRKQMGENGRTLVLEKFRWDDVLSRELYVYKRVYDLVA